MHRIEARLHRGAAMMPPTTSQRRPAMVSRWLRLVRLWNSLRQLPHVGDNQQRVAFRPTSGSRPHTPQNCHYLILWLCPHPQAVRDVGGQRFQSGREVGVVGGGVEHKEGNGSGLMTFKMRKGATHPKLEPHAGACDDL